MQPERPLPAKIDRAEVAALRDECQYHAAPGNCLDHYARKLTWFLSVPGLLTEYPLSVHLYGARRELATVKSRPPVSMAEQRARYAAFLTDPVTGVSPAAMDAARLLKEHAA